MAKKRTPVEKEYYRIRSNLLSTIREAEKRGFVFPEDIVPSIPKKITEGSIRRLKKLSENKYKKLYEKSRYVSYEGETYQGAVGRRKAEKEAREKPKLSTEEKFERQLNIIGEKAVYNYQLEQEKEKRKREKDKKERKMRYIEENDLEYKELKKEWYKETDYDKSNRIEDTLDYILEDKYKDYDIDYDFDELKKAIQESNQEYKYKNQEKEGFSERKKQLPVDSDLIYENILDTLGFDTNIIEEIKKIATNVDRSDFYGRWGEDLYQDSLRSGRIILMLLESEISEAGYDNVAYKLMQHADEVFDAVTGAMYDSNSDKKDAGLARFAQYLKGHSMTLADWRAVSRESEAEENFDLDVMD